MHQGVVQKANFKIVYVAPMKALAAEMTATFSKRLSSLGGAHPLVFTDNIYTGHRPTSFWGSHWVDELQKQLARLQW